MTLTGTTVADAVLEISERPQPLQKIEEKHEDDDVSGY